MPRGIRSNPICSIVGCGKVHYCLGFCKMHYTRLVRHGTTEYKRITNRERFEKFIMPIPETGCWIWMGSDRGFRLNGKIEHINRASYKIFIGDIPTGMEVCHHCDIPLCANPSHFFLGTHLDNMKDCANKGRAYRPIGIKNLQAKLTDQDVIKIRDDKRTYRQIAKEYSIDICHVYRVKSKINWNHL